MAWQPSRGGFWVDEAGGRGRVDEAGWTRPGEVGSSADVRSNWQTCP